jgi:hypothetical protein
MEVITLNKNAVFGVFGKRTVRRVTAKIRNVIFLKIRKHVREQYAHLLFMFLATGHCGYRVLHHGIHAPLIIKAIPVTRRVGP